MEIVEIVLVRARGCPRSTAEHAAHSRLFLGLLPLGMAAQSDEWGFVVDPEDDVAPPPPPPPRHPEAATLATAVVDDEDDSLAVRPLRGGGAQRPHPVSTPANRSGAFESAMSPVADVLPVPPLASPRQDDGDLVPLQRGHIGGKSPRRISALQSLTGAVWGRKAGGGPRGSVELAPLPQEVNVIDAFQLLIGQGGQPGVTHQDRKVVSGP